MNKLPRPSKKSLYLLGLLVITLMGFAIMPTYAKFGSGYTTSNDVSELVLGFNIRITDIEEYEEIVVPAGSYESFNVSITNDDTNTLYYGIWYRMVNPTAKTRDITIARLEGTATLTSGELVVDAIATTSIIIINNSNSDITVNIGVASSTTSTSGIEYLGGKRLITGIAGKPLVNHPNLDNGNLIPVRYDEVDGTGVWRKADSNNANNSWYDYANKMWANAVIVSSDTKSLYQNANNGTIIADEDIVAFFVWIPRFKYRVWNITRQAGDESTYSYAAFSNGIDIEWEIGAETTGNVQCNYDITTIEDNNNLSDKCFYDGIEITTDSLNSDYSNAWYTHPAFTFSGREISGFWMNKYEVSGTSADPKSIPNATSIILQNASTQFTTSRQFQNYLSSNINSHMVTSLEWGAVAYLSASEYGLCNENVCEDVYINNSSGLYTGRSGGAVPGSVNLVLSSVYPGLTEETAKYSEFGYYTYNGYFINYDGTISTTKDESKIASTTRNVTGIYDMVGGARDRTMGNMVNSDYSFFSASAGSSWNGSSTLESKYYTAYSYGIGGRTQMAYNRARLGDATSEIAAVIGSDAASTNGWLLGHNIQGAQVYIVSYPNEESPYVWQSRGSIYSNEVIGIFATGRNRGGTASAEDPYTFRTVLS